ncbi:hypothetical protein BS47DRAFT_1391740 [Hydnum rufescens UP504]|uniref:Uncharacterized protein n=1 Tax=Hydnum rufescens UP504 TaxID=1448309 RepID=A0A9P6B045_9AGAM|nr:hypothetical protein BS47DRAFT_1391740 [Hydnum rufescens UP504]
MSSAPITSSSNAAINLFRAERSADPLRIQFKSDWKSTRIMEWHHSRGFRPTKINTLQLRKEKSKPFSHQYIVLILSGNSILRLDRRCDKDSYCLAELHCHGSNVELSHIIKICFGVTKIPRARRYTLQRFNCYFFAWTILVATARYVEPWHTLRFDSPWRTLSQTLAGALSTKFADALIDMMVDGIEITILTMLFKLKPQLRRACRGVPASRVHTVLRSRLQPALLSGLQPTLRSALADLRVSALRTTLWKDDVLDAMRVAARQDVIDSLLNAGANALSSIRLTEEGLRTFQSLAVTFVDCDFLEGQRGDWPAASIAMFDAMMQATQLFAALGADGFMLDNKKWDEVWNSIRDTVRDAVKDGMKGVEEERWAALWNGLMEEWVAAWEVICPRMRETVRGTVKEMEDIVSNELANSVVKTLPDTLIHIAWGHTVPSRLRRASNSKFIAGLADLAHSELQPYMLKLIRKHGNMVGRYKLGSPARVEKDMRDAMDRVWRVVVELD